MLRAIRLGVKVVIDGNHSWEFHEVMNTRRCASILLCVVSLLILASSPLRGADVFDLNKQLGRGVNILGYDPIWRNRNQARFTTNHFRLIHEAGFGNVRINLQAFSQMTDDATLNPQWWEVADWAVTNALANHLAPILDLHEFQKMAVDPETNKARFLGFWTAVSEHYKNAPDTVVFELLNEPNGKLTPELWNQYIVEALAIIRRSNPTRAVIIGAVNWNSIHELPSLKLPPQDRNIIVTAHYYLPMSFTHQGARWVKEYTDKTGVLWTGSDAEKNVVFADFSKANAWAKTNNRPMFLGEFGAYDKGDMDSRARYTAHVARTAESFGWSWAYWQFDSDFIVYRIDKNEWVDPIRHALIP
jgi:endoglucanase